MISEKTIETLTIEDLMHHPVWEYVNRRSAINVVRPVQEIPAEHLDARVVGSKVVLANGNMVWALLGNIDIHNARRTEHFLTISVERGGKWFTMARYHDVEQEAFGPEALARFLGLTTCDVFPMRYDISAVANSDRGVLVGTIPAEPRERLTRTELINMAL